MYGTEMRANPAAKLVIPIARVRSVGGYWNEVNVGIIALATPVVLLPKWIKQIQITYMIPYLQRYLRNKIYITNQASPKIQPRSTQHSGK